MNKFKILKDYAPSGSGFNRIEYDQWTEDPKNYFSKGEDIKPGDKILVTWPNGFKQIKRLEIQDYYHEEDCDDGYGRWWKIKIHVKKAFFTYAYKGIKHHIFLSNTGFDKITFERFT